MINKNKYIGLSLAVIMGWAFSGIALAADCGEAPTQPEMPDGATATMEQLVASSGEVKTFIADADAYLDCREAAMKSEDYTGLSDEEKASWKEEVKAITASRNAIGDDFNAQVAAFKEANPG